MSINFDVLSEGERFIVCWQYNLHGSFFSALSRAIMQADIVNLAKLEKGFPDEVRAYKMYSQIPGWWDEVRKKAGIVEREEEENAKA